MISEELRKQIEEYINRDDTFGLENFLVEHFKELPEGMQGQLLAAWVEEAAQLVHVKKEGLSAMQKYEELKAEFSKPKGD